MSSDHHARTAKGTATGTAGLETTVSTHILDTAAGRPAPGVPVELAVREGHSAPWSAHGASRTDADGRCKNLPALPAATTHARLTFATEPYLRAGSAEVDGPNGPARRDPDPQRDNAPRPDGPGGSGVPDEGSSTAFFPEVTVAFAVTPGEHHHVPLLLSPFGYSVYRGS